MNNCIWISFPIPRTNLQQSFFSGGSSGGFRNFPQQPKATEPRDRTMLKNSFTPEKTLNQDHVIPVWFAQQWTWWDFKGWNDWVDCQAGLVFHIKCPSLGPFTTHVWRSSVRWPMENSVEIFPSNKVWWRTCFGTNCKEMEELGCENCHVSTTNRSFYSREEHETEVDVFSSRCQKSFMAIESLSLPWEFFIFGILKMAQFSNRKKNPNIWEQAWGSDVLEEKIPSLLQKSSFHSCVSL